jgi:hypothetical protein
MWLFTKTGFVSAVAKPGEGRQMCVRARDRQSLETLAAMSGVEIRKSPHGDYPYRVFVDMPDFGMWVIEAVTEINYSNFKSEMHKHRDYNYADALGQVWLAMTSIEDSDARKEGN